MIRTARRFSCRRSQVTGLVRTGLLAGIPLLSPAHSMAGFGNNSSDLLLVALGFFLIFLLIRYARHSWLVEKVDTLMSENSIRYDEILNASNPYYRSLDHATRERFLRRLLFFMESKEFEYVDMEAQEEMPVMISAAAIQITFGLKNYLLDYFSRIYVLKNRYRYGQYAQAFEGHVSEEGIYLSWTDFSREYKDYGDGENLGIHEMAHALTYVNFTVQDGMDGSFRSRFHAFSPIARPVFERMQAGESTLLDKYAATTYEEFWAVSVEAFFEKPEMFREQLPSLYDSLCKLLNQDPTHPAKVLDPTQI